MGHRALVLAIVSLGFSLSAQATALFGGTVRITHEYTGSGTISGPFDATVDGNVEAPSVLGFYSVDLADTTVLVDYAQFPAPGGAAYDAVAFNGLHILDLGGTIRPIIGVTINNTNITGLDASRVTFDGDNIFVNFAGLTVFPTSTVLLDVELVPEPYTFGLAALGLAGLALRRRLG